MAQKYKKNAAIAFVMMGCFLLHPNVLFAQEVEILEEPKEDLIKVEERQFSKEEIRILQELEKRRIDLERREKALELRERLVDLAEARLLEKIATMQSLKKEIEGMLENLSDKEEEELVALAKIYESMKPAAAASVLNRMDNKIVFDLFKRIKKKNTAKIIEKMATGKARLISEMLAERRELPPYEKVESAEGVVE